MLSVLPFFSSTALGIFLAYMLMRRFRLFVALPSLLYLAISVYTYVGVHIFVFAADIPFSLFDDFTPYDIVRGCALYSLLSVSTSAGCLLVSKPNSLSKTPYLPAKLIKNTRIHKATLQLAAISAFPLLCALINYNIGDLIYRDFYFIPPSFPKLAEISSLLSLFVALVCGYKGGSVFTLLALLNASLLFSLNTRGMALFLILFFIASALRRNIHPFRLLLYFLIVICFSTAPLIFRDSYPQGLIGNVVSLFSESHDQPFRFLIFSINYAFAYPVAALLSSLAFDGHDPSLFTTSISILPSFLDQSSDIVSKGMINTFAPLTANGLMYLTLGFLTFPVYALLSFISCFFSVKVLRTELMSTILSCFILFTALISSTYNLRSFSRFIYFLLPLTIVLRYLEMSLLSKRVEPRA